MSKKELLLEKIKENNGVITTKQVIEYGIHKDVLKNMVIKEELEKQEKEEQERKEKEEKEKQERLEKEKKYQDFLKKNEGNYDKIVKEENKIVLYKKVDEFLF